MNDHVFIIAEAGVNHNGSLEMAERLVRAAKAAGADAVKFQTFKAERLVTKQAEKAEYQKVSSGAGESQFAMLKRLELSEAQHRELLALCRSIGIEFMSTGFDEESADFLAGLGIQRVKIPSGEVTNLPFLRHLARQGMPVILSTGMAELEEVRQAVAAIRAEANVPITVLHCVSNYPAAPGDVNLRAMTTMRDALGVPVGYSDHTMGIEVAIGAAAMGAVCIEKHLTLDRTLPGPDHAASLEPAEFAEMVRCIRSVSAALGDGIKRPAPSEVAVAKVIRKSVVAITDIAAGVAISAEHIGIMRPATGLPPSERDNVLGRTARQAIPAGTALTWEMLA